MTGSGTVIATLAAGVAHDAVPAANSASTSTDNSVTYDNVAPTVTIVQASGQADPTNATPINFTATFSESVTGFATGDVDLGGTAGANTAVVTGSGTTYNVAVSGMTDSGTVGVAIPASKAIDAAGNNNTASAGGDNVVTYNKPVAPTVTVNQASGQADPTSASPVNFTVVFSAAVTDFAAADVTLGGTAIGSKSAVVTGSGTTYNVAVSGMTGSGTVTASLAAGVAHDAGTNANSASTSSDNAVTYNMAVGTQISGKVEGAGESGTVSLSGRHRHGQAERQRLELRQEHSRQQPGGYSHHRLQRQLHSQRLDVPDPRTRDRKPDRRDSVGHELPERDPVRGVRRGEHRRQLPRLLRSLIGSRVGRPPTAARHRPDPTAAVRVPAAALRGWQNR